MAERSRLPARVVLLAVVVGAGMACSPRPDPAPDPPPDPPPDRPLAEITARLDQRIPALMARYEIPGVIAGLVREGETVWTAAYGLADVAAGRPMTVDTRCRMESISKSVTAWGVLTLAERGELDLDAPVGRYLERWPLPESPFDEGAVTPRLLLANAAGMPLGTVGVHYPPGGPRPSLQEKLTGDAVLVREPGTAFAYSNAGYNVLEQLVQEVTGRDFGEYMAAEVLRPLGMETASYDWSDDWDPPVPDGHDPAGRPIPVYVYPDRGSGGLFATVHDIAAFAQAGMPRYRERGEAVLDPDAVRLLHTPAIALDGFYGLAFDAYGLGHFVERLPSGHLAIANGGQGSGWMTHFHAVPETGDAIILLTNSQRAWPFFARILGDWARWAGYGGVGMGVIVMAARALRVGVALLILIAGAQLLRTVGALRSGRRRLGLHGGFEPRRAAALLAAVVMGAGLLWATTRDYLFLTAVFPVAAPWLGWALLFTAAVLALTGLAGEGEPAG